MNAKLLLLKIRLFRMSNHDRMGLRAIIKD